LNWGSFNSQDNVLISMVIIQPRVFTVFFSLQAVALAARRLLRSSEMLSLTPLSRGREMYALLPLPMMKTLFNLRKREKSITNSCLQN